MSGTHWLDQLDVAGLPTATLKSSTEELIRQSLLDGDMKPGEIYSANALAKRLGTSNSPVREAMMSLTHRGLLELVRNRGFRVVEMTPEDRREVYTLRELIEVEAVRRLAQRGVSQEEGQKLHQLAVNTLKTLTDSSVEDLQPYLEADDTFHSYMVGLLGNRRLKDFVETLRDQSRVNGTYFFLPEQGLLIPSAQEHIDMATAIVERDDDRAAALMLNHLAYAKPDAGN